MTTNEALGHARAALQKATSGSTRSISTGEAMGAASVLEAALQALADVRTLDGYDPDWMARGALPGGFCAVRDRCSCDKARAKAAAWVRGQK